MWLLDKNYAVTTKLSNPTGIVPKCPKNCVGTLRTCRSVLGPKCGRSEVSWVRSVCTPEIHFRLQSQDTASVILNDHHHFTFLIEMNNYQLPFAKTTKMSFLYNSLYYYYCDLDHRRDSQTLYWELKFRPLGCSIDSIVVVVVLKKSERRSRGPLCPDLA